jgi:hypothetical protein
MNGVTISRMLTIGSRWRGIVVLMPYRFTATYLQDNRVGGLLYAVAKRTLHFQLSNQGCPTRSLVTNVHPDSLVSSSRSELFHKLSHFISVQ